MQSKKAKVLHPILGKPMILYILETVSAITRDIILVIGHQGQKVRDLTSQEYKTILVKQDQQLGTGHAVLCAAPYLPSQVKNIVILCGDTPLIRAASIQNLIKEHNNKKQDITVLAVEIENPAGYGRILFNNQKQLIGIIEEKDANARQRKLKLINSGIYCIKKKILNLYLKQIKPDNAQAEYYLTDIIKLAHKEKLGVFSGVDPDEIKGVNTPQDLKKVEDILKNS